MAMSLNCPLCREKDTRLFAETQTRNFFECPGCGLIFVPGEQHLSLHEEIKRYLLHDNSFSNRGYVEYLKGIAGEVGNIKVKDPLILDFGSGKNSVLGSLLEQKGCRAVSYDPLYSIGSDFEEKRYDIVVMCEVAEHLRDPFKELRRIKGLIKPGGYILIRTALFDGGQEDFIKWWYIQDSTHICFYRRESVAKIAEIIGAEIIFIKDKNMVLLRAKT